MNAKEKMLLMRRQHGLAMLALVTLLALVSSYFIASALTRTTTAVQNVRESSNLQTLNSAKAALISWVAQDTFTKGTGSFQPGSLPCPDTNDDGYAEGTCSSAASRIGRFPWRTVNAPDLRDSSGERLWYALSDSFRAASGTTVINPDTSGALSLSGSISSTTVPAIIFAPGPAFSTQSRNSAGWNTASNYLEGWSTGASNYSYLAATARNRLTIGGHSTLVTPNEEDCSDATREPYCLLYNDTLVLVTNEDIFKVAEGTVPAMLQELVSTGALNTGSFNSYYSTWLRYPFPAQFTNPTTSNFKGTVGQTNGLLPITTDSTFVTWRTSPTPSWTNTAITPGIISSQNCSASTSTLISCDITWTNRPTIEISLNLNGAGQAFVGALTISNISLFYISNGLTLTPTISTGGYPIHSLAPYQSSNSWGTITIRMRLPTRNTGYGTVRLRVSVPSLLAITSSSDSTTGWMLRNQWHRYLQYSVAAGYLPNSAAGTCTAGTNCLTVTGLPSSFTSSNDKRVILAFGGRALAADPSASPAFSAQTHHSSSLVDYFEGANAVADTLFTHQQAASRSFNDKIVIVAP